MYEPGGELRACTYQDSDAWTSQYTHMRHVRRYARDKIYAMEIGKFQLLAAFFDLNGTVYAHQLMLHMMSNLFVSPAANAAVQKSLGKFIR